MNTTLCIPFVDSCGAAAILKITRESVNIRIRKEKLAAIRYQRKNLIPLYDLARVQGVSLERTRDIAHTLSVPITFLYLELVK